MARRGNSETISTQVRDQLRTDILAGTWSPGEKLLLSQLSEMYQTSSTVVREALTRLSGDRLVDFKPNRGFFVPQLSLSELRDFNELRCITEGLGIRLAIERGGLEWESEVLAAHHRLERTQHYQTDAPTQLNDDWVVAHAAFHAKLLEACQVSVITELASTLADATALYRRWGGVAPANTPRDVEGEHRAILEAVTSRNAELAAELLRQHYTKTTEVILSSGLVSEHPVAAH